MPYVNHCKSHGHWTGFWTHWVSSVPSGAVEIWGPDSCVIHRIFSGTVIAKNIKNGNHPAECGKAIINHPYFFGLYNAFMVDFGMIYCMSLLKSNIRNNIIPQCPPISTDFISWLIFLLWLNHEAMHRSSVQLAKGVQTHWAMEFRQTASPGPICRFLFLFKPMYQWGILKPWIPNRHHRFQYYLRGWKLNTFHPEIPVIIRGSKNEPWLAICTSKHQPRSPPKNMWNDWSPFNLCWTSRNPPKVTEQYFQDAKDDVSPGYLGATLTHWKQPSSNFTIYSYD